MFKEQTHLIWTGLNPEAGRRTRQVTVILRHSSPVQGYVGHPKQKLKKQKVYALLPTLLGLV